MIVHKSTCPKCGYVELPVTHREDNGKMIKLGGRWICDACGNPFDRELTRCNRCGHSYPGNNVEVDLPL